MFSKNIFPENIFPKNIFDKNIFSVNIFGNNIFYDPSSIWLPYKQPLPLLSSSSVIFDVECDTTKDKRTHGPDGAMFVPFIVLDFGMKSILILETF